MTDIFHCYCPPEKETSKECVCHEVAYRDYSCVTGSGITLGIAILASVLIIFKATSVVL
jgi:hypothetical protein